MTIQPRHHDEGAVCLCVKDHRPAALELNSHHVWPLEFDGPNIPANRVWLCPNAHANTHELLRLMLKAGRTLSNRELDDLETRPVNRYSAELARLGWRRITAQAMVAAEGNSP